MGTRSRTIRHIAIRTPPVAWRRLRCGPTHRDDKEPSGLPLALPHASSRSATASRDCLAARAGFFVAAGTAATTGQRRRGWPSCHAASGAWLLAWSGPAPPPPRPSCVADASTKPRPRPHRSPTAKPCHLVPRPRRDAGDTPVLPATRPPRPSGCSDGSSSCRNAPRPPARCAGRRCRPPAAPW